MKHVVARLLFSAALGAFGLSGASPSSAQGSSESGTLTIHERICFADDRIEDPFASCHDNILGASSEYQVTSNNVQQTRSTDAATGNVTFQLTGTSAAISDPWGSDRYFHDVQPVCTVDGSGQPVEEYQAGEGASGGLGIKYAEGSSVTCDWYLYADPDTRALPSASPIASPNPQ